RLIYLGESSSRLLGTWARPHLATLVDTLGETANLAMLDGDQVVYVAQVPSRHSMRMFTEVGRRVMPHCTAVGKALLAQLPESEVRELVQRTGMPARTEHTITSPADLAGRLVAVREKGFALDEGEQEVGVRCVAVAVVGAPARIALSISGPMPRMTDDLVGRAIPVLQAAAAALTRDLAVT
ncbi:MAG: IclR family transcriptional regulator, partial [Propionibacteriales bacterium]|nr:IclR family transcriptional regulator [Propionibacteriales bacterium]